METPYVDLLRMAWRLWWRHVVLVALLVALLVAPFAIVALRYPTAWPLLREAISIADVARPGVLLPVYLVMNLLVCYPLAVQWLLRRGRGKGIRGGGGHAASRRSQDQQTFLLAWRVFWMPLLWDCANLGLGYALVWARPEHPKLPVALAAIAINTMLVNLMAMLPLNLRRVGMATWRNTGHREAPLIPS